MAMAQTQRNDNSEAYESYVARFDSMFNARPEGAFVKFGHVLVRKLGRPEFDARLEAFLRVRERCKRMIESGATISDAIALDFEEAAAWLAVETPNLLELFHGEVGADGGHFSAPPEIRHSPQA